MCSVGIESKVASDGESALDLYSECCASGESFDLVLIDLTIKGGLGGRKTMQRLLEIDPDVRGVVISGYSDDKVMSNYKDYGFVGRLQKPFSLDELQMLFLNQSKSRKEKIEASKSDWEANHAAFLASHFFTSSLSQPPPKVLDNMVHLAGCWSSITVHD